MSEGQSPWVLVPREITKEMAHVLESNFAECLPPSEVHRANWANAYRAMLAAAPSSPAGSEAQAEHREAPKSTDGEVEKLIGELAEYAPGARLGHLGVGYRWAPLLERAASTLSRLSGERDYAWAEMKNAQAYWKAETAHAEQAEAECERLRGERDEKVRLANQLCIAASTYEDRTTRSEALLEGARGALENIRIEGDRKEGNWVHLKRVIALNAREALRALTLGGGSTKQGGEGPP